MNIYKSTLYNITHALHINTHTPVYAEPNKSTRNKNIYTEVVGKKQCAQLGFISRSGRRLVSDMLSSRAYRCKLNVIKWRQITDLFIGPNQ